MNPIWERCLELALVSMSHRSLAIAAVITTAEGRVLAWGRNQLYDASESGNKIVNNPIAHAEVNAIANLPVENRNDPGLTLYTTLEPCPMCMGAITMARIRTLVIAARDTWAGSTNLTKFSPYIASKQFKISFEQGEIEKLFCVLNFCSLLNCKAEFSLQLDFMQKLQQQNPAYMDLAVRLSRDTDFQNCVKAHNTRLVSDLVLT